MSEHNRHNKKEQKLKPFTEGNKEELCITCKFRSNCQILQFVNKLSIKRDGEVADDQFSCLLYSEKERV